MRLTLVILAAIIIGCGYALFANGLYTQPYVCGGYYKNAESIPHMVNATTKDVLCWHSGINNINVCDSHLASDNVTTIRNCSLEPYLYIEFYTQNSTVASWFDGRKATSPTGMEIVGPMMINGQYKQYGGVAIMIIGGLVFMCCFSIKNSEDKKLGVKDEKQV